MPITLEDFERAVRKSVRNFKRRHYDDPIHRPSPWAAILPPREFPRPSITLGTAGEPSTSVPSMSVVATCASLDDLGIPPDVFASDKPSGLNGA